MTAAHVVQAADRVVVEFSEGEQIPAEVIASVITADVALKLEWVLAGARSFPISDTPPMMKSVIADGFPDGNSH